MVYNFPVIGKDEFDEACRCLEDRCQDGLDSTGWLSVKWHGDALHVRKTYRVPGPIDDPEDPLTDADADGEVTEELQEPPLPRHNPDEPPKVVVDFCIILSPTYQVPVLWFVMAEVPRNGLRGIEAVYRYLVPSSSEAQLKTLGVMGGISVANHPLSDLPAFFIHPCNTQEALKALHEDGRSIAPEHYLFLWLGLAGASVGLHIPSKLLAS